MIQVLAYAILFGLVTFGVVVVVLADRRWGRAHFGDLKSSDLAALERAKRRKRGGT